MKSQGGGFQYDLNGKVVTGKSTVEQIDERDGVCHGGMNDDIHQCPGNANIVIRVEDALQMRNLIEIKGWRENRKVRMGRGLLVGEG